MTETEIYFLDLDLLAVSIGVYGLVSASVNLYLATRDRFSQFLLFSSLAACLYLNWPGS